ncbi:hypothetical protein DYB36_006238 [Aphanomyces astaci]|uniref:Uncharacterized protein n=1 Tax=Aphanomyces astaci TaxID=112090 RepID=A0A397B7L9_APHAT|nr:hypothetical protein DYB36_006238 [Aphanomyces astaci]
MMEQALVSPVPIAFSRKLSSDSSFSENANRDQDELSDRSSENHRSLTDAIGDIFMGTRRTGLSFPKMGSWRKGNGNKYAENGDLEYLVENSDNLNFSTGAMDLAAANGHLDVVQWLHVHRSEGCTTKAFDGACANGRIAVVTWLHLNRMEGGTSEAMDGAASNGHLDVVKFLHKHRHDKERCTPAALDHAAGHGHLAVVVWLHFNRSEGCTTLAMDKAALNGHVEILNFLLEHRKERFTNVLSTLTALVKAGDVATFEWMAENVCDDLQYFAVMDTAVVESQVGILTYIYDKKHGFCSRAVRKKGNAATQAFLDASLHGQYWDATYPIDFAASHGFLLFVEYLHNTQLPQLASEMALNAAATNGHLDVVTFLHDSRSDGCTTDAMDGAATNGHLNIVTFLHHHRAEGCTVKAMDMAADYGHLEIVKFLHAERTEGCTVYALNAAASSGHLEVVEFLASNQLGQPFLAIDFAVQHGHLDVVRYLHEQHGAMCLKSYFDLCADAATKAYLQDCTKHPALWDMEPLDFAAGEDREDLVAWFEQIGHSTYTAQAMDRAAANGFVDVVKRLHDTRTEGCTVDAMDYASANGHLTVLQTLYEYYGHRYTSLALDLAAGNGHLEVLVWFDSMTSDARRMIQPTSNAMDWAARNGHLDVIEYLHDHKSTPCSPKALDLAAKMGHLDIVMWLYVTRGAVATPSTMDAAACGGHLEIVQYLHSTFPDVPWSSKTVDGALRAGHVEIADWCVAHGLPQSAATKDLAAKKGSLALVRRFCQDEPVSYLCDALEAATQYGHVTVVEFIHSMYRLFVLRKPYKKAHKGKHVAVCRYLEATHLEFWAQNAVDVAGSHNNLPWVQWLMAKKKEMASAAAIDHAAANGHFEMVQWLHDNGCACTTDAMDAAAALGRLDMVTWFHETRREGCTTDAMDLASQHGHFAVMRWLHLHREEGCTAYALNICAFTGRLDILQWLSEIISVSTKSSSVLADVQAGDFDPDLDPSEVEAMKALPDERTLQPPETPKEASRMKLKSDSTDMLVLNVIDYAVMQGHVEIVQWLHEAKSEHWSAAAVDAARHKRHTAVLEYVDSWL